METMRYEHITSQGAKLLYTIENGHAIITKLAEPFAGALVLPAIIDEHPVTEIGGAAFAGCKALTSVCLPESVTKIWFDAFADCIGLTSVIIPKRVTTIEPNVFDGCSRLKIEVDERNPAYCSRDGVLFDKAMRTLVAAPGVKGEYVIPEDVECIAEGAFEENANVRSVIIPKRVAMIEEAAFSGCSALTSIVIPKGVRVIKEAAFRWCDSLTLAVISESVTNLSPEAFINCPVQQINVDANNPSYCSRDGVLFDKAMRTLIVASGVTDGYVIPEGVTCIECCAFSENKALTTIRIPNGVTDIGEWAFCGCDNLRTIWFEGAPPKMTDDWWLEFAVGRYPAAFREAWEAVLDENGCWHGLRMEPEV